MKTKFKKPTYTVTGFETNYGPWIYHSYADREDMIITTENVLYCFEITGSDHRYHDSSAYRFPRGYPPPTGPMHSDGKIIIVTDKFHYSTKIKNGQFSNEWMMTTGGWFLHLALGNMQRNKEYWLKHSRHGSTLKYWTDSFFPNGTIQANQIKKWGIKKLLERIGNQPIMITDEDINVCDKIKKVSEFSKDGIWKDIPVEERYDEDRIVRSNH